MKFSRCVLFAVLWLLPLWLQAAPGPVRKGAVQAELVAPVASIQPGQVFRVAVRLDHDAHWHSYWINPGTGYPTTLRWKLPEGFKAGPIIWPTPHRVQDTRGNITGNGYEETIFLFVDLTAPATLTPGESVTLRTTADWLMCSEVCMPGRADLELTLPVRTETPEPNAAIAPLFNRAAAELPRPLAGWELGAARTGPSIVVRLKAAAGNPHRPQNLHVFDADGLIDYAGAQSTTDEDGSIVLTLPVSKDAPAEAAKFSGVIVSSNGWGEGHTTPGATFDTKFGAPAASATAATSLTASMLLVALLGGLILNLMPCVFPVLGIKVLGFVNQSGNERRKVVMHGLIFSLGVLLSFWALAGTLLVLRAGGDKLGWGFQLQSPGFVFGMAVVLLVFALNLSGLFEIGLSATGVGGKLQMQSGYAGSFFTGVLATVVATPCSAPFLAPALGVALALAPMESFLVFTVIAVGLSLPYLLLSLFPAAVKLLPRPGAWMETFKQFMSFLLYATVGALLWVLVGQTQDNEYTLLLVMFGLVLVAMAAWAYGRFHKPVSRLIALGLIVGGIALGWPKPELNKWQAWSPEAVATAQAAGRTIYVDFTARWCATCQTNKLIVFKSKQVLAELKKRNVLLLKGDWTNRDPAITAELEKWGRSAVPFNLIYAPGKSEPVILPELLTPGIVLEKLESTGR